MEQKKELNFINLYNAKGEKHGYWEDYHSNGQLWSKGNYVAGNRHGYFEVYYYNGNLMYKVNFVDGKKHGLWEDYYSNGNLSHKGFYDQGNQVDYNPDELKQIELTLDEIATKFGISIKQLKIKK